MITLKHATEDDAEILTDLGRRTFIETYAKVNTPSNMALYLAETFGVEIQRREIRDPRRIIAIAWIEDQAVGFLHLLKGPADPSVTGVKPIEILRIYADARWHGKGVGVSLMEKALALAQSQGCDILWLGVWEKNLRAQAFYKKYGFHVVGEHLFRLGTDEQTDLIMSRSL